MNQSTSMKPHNSATLIYLCNTASSRAIEHLKSAEIELHMLSSLLDLLTEFPSDVQVKALKKLDIPFEYTELADLRETIASLCQLISETNLSIEST